MVSIEKFEQWERIIDITIFLPPIWNEGGARNFTFVTHSPSSSSLRFNVPLRCLQFDRNRNRRSRARARVYRLTIAGRDTRPVKRTTIGDNAIHCAWYTAQRLSPIGIRRNSACYRARHGSPRVWLMTAYTTYGWILFSACGLYRRLVGEDSSGLRIRGGVTIYTKRMRERERERELCTPTLLRDI